MSFVIRAMVLGVAGLLLSTHVSVAEEEGSAPFRETVAAYKGNPVPDTVRAKIIGGVDANWTEHKWQVALLVSWIADPTKAQFCGGSIVASKWVVTAAHCVVDGTKPDDVHILSGTDDLRQAGARVNVDTILVHKDYSPSSHDSDIALLHVNGELVGKPITLAAESDDAAVSAPAADASLTVTGWGKTESGLPSPQLKVVSVRLVSRKKCNAPPSYDGAITENMICAGLDQGGKDSCQGDSGGPATISGKLAGIVSWGAGCAIPFKFGVYSNVAKLSRWVSDCIANPGVCPKR